MKYCFLLAGLAASYISAVQAEGITDRLEGEFSGNMALTSNYVWRGFSLTDNGPALQGNATFTHQTGFYVSLWSSSVDFDNGGNGYLELAPSVGFASNFANGLGYDLGVVQYYYPKASNQDYPEVYANVSYSIFKVGIAYSNDVFSSGENGAYYSAGVDYDIPSQYLYNMKDIGLGATVGYSQLDGDAGNSYVDYSVSISKKFAKHVKGTLAWTDTNGKFDAGDLDDAHVVGTISVDL